MLSDPQGKKTSPLTLAAAWIVVAIPLAWGVSQTAIKALPLFAAPAAQAVHPPVLGSASDKPPADRRRWAGKATDETVESSLSPPRQRRREMA